MVSGGSGATSPSGPKGALGIGAPEVEAVLPSAGGVFREASGLPRDLAAQWAWGRQRRRRRLFDTTDTLDRVMAPAASIGSSPPSAATGIAAAL